MELEKNENAEGLNDEKLNEVAGGEGNTVTKYRCYLCGVDYDTSGYYHRCPKHPWVKLEEVT